MRFLDYLSYHRINGAWLITAKSFHVEPRYEVTGAQEAIVLAAALPGVTVQRRRRFARLCRQSINLRRRFFSRRDGCAGQARA
jgi:hypothetical protein